LIGQVKLILKAKSAWRQHWSAGFSLKRKIAALGNHRDHSADCPRLRSFLRRDRLAR